MPRKIETHSNQPSRCLITGASGFLGRALSARLKQMGWYIRALHRSDAAGLWDDQALCDLGTETLPKDLMQDIDYVFHLAGKAHDTSDTGNLTEYEQGIVKGTQALLRAASESSTRRFIFVSTVKVMRDSSDTLSETDTPKPTTPYGIAKLKAEKAIQEWSHKSDLNYVILRPAMIYGEGCKGNLVRMIDAIQTGWFPPLPHNTGHRSMIHVDDVVSALTLCCNHGEAANQVFFLTDSQSYSTREIYDSICAALDKNVPRWGLPLGIFKALAKSGDLAGQLRGRPLPFNSHAYNKLLGNSLFDSSKIERCLRFRASHSLIDSMPQIVEARLKERKRAQT